MALALARKYRPKSFASVAVQSHVSTTLKGAIARGRVAHGYLFCGPRGTGKTTLARVLAMALNCERPGEHGDGEPCGHCASCTRIWAGSASLDVVEIDAASNRGVDDARELRERAMYAPSGDTKYKVYIVDEAHMLTREAWNALLKILEEPPPRVVFIFATTEPQKIAQAAAPVLSRVQRFDLKRIPAHDVRLRLTTVLEAEGVAIDADALGLLARAADGSMRDALSLTDQVLALHADTGITGARVREALGLVPDDEYLALLDVIAAHDAGAVFPAVARLADLGVDFVTVLGGLADALRAQLAVVLGGSAPDVSTVMADALAARRERWHAADLVRMLGAVTELEPRFRKSSQQRLLLEMLLVRCALLDRAVDLDAVLRELQGGAPGGAPAGPSTGKSSGPTGSTAVPPRTPPLARDKAGAAATFGATAAPTRSIRPEASGASGTMVSGDARRAIADADPIAVDHAVDRAVATTASLVAGWPEIIRVVRAMSPLLASAVEQATPVAVDGARQAVVRLAEPNEFTSRKLESGRADLAAAIARVAGAVAGVRVEVATIDGAGPARRLTAEAVKGEQVARLRKQDALLGAAIDALDLELLGEGTD